MAGIIIPNVEFVLGLVGATLGTAVCSVAPAWIYLQVAPSTSNERWIAKVRFIIIRFSHSIRLTPIHLGCFSLRHWDFDPWHCSQHLRGGNLSNVC